MPQTWAPLPLPRHIALSITSNFFVFLFSVRSDFFVFLFSFPTTELWLQILASDFISLSLKVDAVMAPGIPSSWPCVHPFKDENQSHHSGGPSACSQLPLTASSRLLPPHLRVLTPARPLPESQHLNPGAPGAEQRWEAQLDPMADLWVQLTFSHCHHHTQPQARSFPE